MFDTVSFHLMFPFFILFCCSDVFDLSPPFNMISGDKMEYWDFSGSTLVLKDKIQIVPPVQFKKGAVWSNLQMPKSAWSANFEFKYRKGNKGTHFGIWYIDKYNAEGGLIGGPNVYRGFAVICLYKEDFRHSFLEFYFEQNNGGNSIDINKLNSPFMKMNYTQGATFYVEITVDDRRIIISVNENVCFNDELSFDISKNYLGITATTTHYVASLELYSVRFKSLSETDLKKRRVFMNNKNSDSYKPEQFTLYRNPKFEMIHDEKLKMNENKEYQSTFEHLLQVIQEVYDVTAQVVSFSELNDYITQNIVPYTVKYQQRTLKISDIMRNSLNTVGMGMNYTSQVLISLNKSITENSNKMRTKSSSLVQLFNEIDDDFNINEIIKDSGSLLSSSLLIIGLSEFITFILILTFFSTNKGKQWINW